MVFLSKNVNQLFSQSSNMLNQARLKVLKVREDHVRNVLDEARKRLGEVINNTAKYSEILTTLTLQGTYQVSVQIYDLYEPKKLPSCFF